ncbi:hypothetical protein FRB95_011561 [Tulasnella sp. JGI-2019a]|nr:hypothetical protein FRB95_011561 [Tulasnella sp. JGI-2019a]
MASTVIGVCSDCVKGYRLPGEATGEMTQVDNVPAYFRSAPSLTQGQDTAEKKAIVLVSDIFGLQLDNIKIIADELSKRVGVDAFAPDYFLGKPPFKFEDVGPYLLPKRPGQIHTWGETFSFIWALLRNFTGALSIPTIFRPAVVNARLEDFLKGLRAQGYTRIGVLG